MKLVLTILTSISLLMPTLAKAENELCPKLEGVRLKLNCKVPQPNHVCNSGGPSYCNYIERIKWKPTIDVTTSKGDCAGPLVDPCASAPPGEFCNQNPYCPNELQKTVYTCKITCSACGEGETYNPDVFCNQFCATPKCPQNIVANGKTWWARPQETCNSNPPPNCQKPPGFREGFDTWVEVIEDCLNKPLPQPNPGSFDPGACCSASGNFGLPLTCQGNE